MYKITDIQTLGTDYTVADRNGVVIRTIQIIPHNEILEAALGEYDEAIFGDFAIYLEKSIAVLSGFDDVSPVYTLWHATLDEEVVLADIIEYAIKHDYDRIILEHLEPTE